MASDEDRQDALRRCTDEQLAELGPERLCKALGLLPLADVAPLLPFLPAVVTAGDYSDYHVHEVRLVRAESVREMTATERRVHEGGYPLKPWQWEAQKRAAEAAQAAFVRENVEVDALHVHDKGRHPPANTYRVEQARGPVARCGCGLVPAGNATPAD